MTRSEKDADCGTAANGYTTSGPSITTITYDVYGNVIATNDPDANASIDGHLGCTVNSVQHTTCATFDSTYAVLPLSTTNTLNQTASISYSGTGALNGYGFWPASMTDLNSQTTSYSYDFLGRMTGQALPGESTGKQTTQWVYTNWCSGTSAQSPCQEIDEIVRINDSTTMTKRAFYDGLGRLVETRSPGFNNQDVSSGRQIFKSNPYFVAAYTGAPGAAAYSIPDSSQLGTSKSYPTLLQSSVTDPNSHTTTSSASVICGVSGTSDSGCYVQSTNVDANNHQTVTLTGGLGKTNYLRLYTGDSSYTLYSTTVAQYDSAGELVSTIAPDGNTTTTLIYDDLGQVVSLNDPDSGVTTATYDPNGNQTSLVDARGSAGTIYGGYDGLNRLLWRNTTNSPTGAWASYSYDSTADGNKGIGKLTSESFTGSGGLSGSYSNTYDARGQQTAQIVTVNGTNYTIAASYDDAGHLLTATYPTGEVVTLNYSSTDWLLGLTTNANGTNTTIASGITYSGLAGAAGAITSMNLGGSVYSYAASYDTGMRLTSAQLANSGSTRYQTQPAYDAANNVVSVQTSISGQTDTQQFCYDDLNRLIWSGTNGTPPCTGTSINAGTIVAAQYQQTDAYDVNGRLTTGPAGTYTYGNSSHPHALMSTSSGYSADYDAAGNMICRALSGATTCSGPAPTGQLLSYDSAGRLSQWQNLPDSPTATVNYLYDGGWQRVAMQSVVNGTTTTTAYINGIQEVKTTGGGTQTTTYYVVGGERVAAAVDGTFYSFGYDALQ